MARSFNGSTDKITIASGFDPAIIPFSISFWVKFTNTGITNGLLTSTGSTGMTMDLGGGQIRFYQTGNGVIATSGSVGGSGVWLLVGLSWDGTNYAVYLNGSPSTSGTSATSVSTGQGPYTLGLPNALAGSMADVAWWGVILTATEFAGLGTGIRPPTIRRASLGGYWPLDGLQSPEPDLSGHAYNGTLTGTALVSGPPTTLFTPRRPVQFISSASPSVATPIFPSAPLGGVLRRFRIAA